MINKKVRMKQQMTKARERCILIFITLSIIFCFESHACAEPTLPFRFGFNVEPAQSPKDTASTIQLLLLLTILSLAPAIIIMMTSFTRTVIVLSFLRNALGTQQMPPNQVLIGLALFLTFFIMAPVGKEINDNALQPFIKEEISQEEAFDRSSKTIKSFMLEQIFKNDSNGKDLELFTSMADIKVEGGVNPEKLPLNVVIPAFIISELTVAFKMGFLIYIPFLVIDMVVASTLMSMGMMMLPPIMISLPFKILLFIMVDGWGLVARTIISSFTA